ncbi:MAG TPA: Zn-ribbon containing protein [Candidatus Nanoarchaeia archaeon]|nr:Zn-ribbon containing protein [Candidatus Nanoarchaeia archaeon]
MAYKCVHCSKTYQDKSPELTSGCSCGSKFFFYIKNDKLKEIEENRITLTNLTTKEKEQMEEDVREIAGIEDQEQPVFLDFESVTVVGPGKYLVDVQRLLSTDKPRIYKLEDGKYIIDLSMKSKKSNKNGK